MSKIPDVSLRKNIPSTASVAIPGQDGRLLAPAADRNANPILDLVVKTAPETGQALEIASGTGQHIVKLAAALPELTWQPSDIDPLRITSIKTWSLDKTLVNLKTPVLLDATQVGCGRTRSECDKWKKMRPYDVKVLQGQLRKRLVQMTEKDKRN